MDTPRMNEPCIFAGLSVADLVRMERDGSEAAELIESMSDETLAELGERVKTALVQAYEAKIQDSRLDDLAALGTQVRYVLRRRRATATLKELFAWVPR